VSKLLDIAEEWADMIYPEIPSGPHHLQRKKIRTAYMLGFERGYKIAARARLSGIQYMTNEEDKDAT